MNPTGATIFVVDDDASVRRGLERLLRSAGWNVETCVSASAFLERPPYAGIGCMVLDIRMPEMTGPELHDRMVERGFSLPVIFLTGHGDVPTSVRAMKKGAADFLLKPVDDEVLLRTISQAVERHAAEKATQARQQEILARIARLSAREIEVMRHVIQGRLNKQIGADLGITEKTVKTHRGEVMHKMNAGSVAELVRLCEAAGIKPR
jgi:FixJ family two-component response regulator